MLFLKLFTILTNITAIVPTLYSFKSNKYYEGMIYFLTCIASLVYHVIYAFNTVESTTIKAMVKYVDFLLAYCCISSIIYFLLINNDKHRHSLLLISMYTEMYFNYINISSIGHLLTSLFISFILSYLYNINLKDNLKKNKRFYKKKYIFIGMVLNVIEFIFFFVLSVKYHNYYYIWHGLHHICGFLSIYFYLKSVKNYKNEIHNISIQTISPV